MSKTALRRPVPACLALAALAAAEPLPQIGITVNTPTVTLAPRSGGRFIELPGMVFEFALRPECPADWQPSSVLLSIADTTRSLRASDLQAEPVAPVTLEVPAGQLAPVAAAGFCRADEDGLMPPDQAVLMLRDTLSAHASLRCSGDGDDIIAYVSKPLDVTILCEWPPMDDSAAAGSE